VMVEGLEEPPHAETVKATNARDHDIRARTTLLQSLLNPCLAMTLCCFMEHLPRA